MGSHYFRRLLILLTVFALVVAACGDSEGGGDPATTTTGGGEPGTTTQPPEGEVQLAGLNVVDDLTFTVEFTEADPEFPLKLAYAAFFPLPDVALGPDADLDAFEESPIGNGPFRMDGQWQHDVAIPLVRNDDYAGPDPASIDALEFTIIDDLNTAYNEVLAGNLDVLGPTIPADQIEAARNDFGDRFGQSSSTSFTYLGFPTYLPEFTTEHRQALSMAIDRQTIMDVIYSGTRVPANSAIPPIFDGARPSVCASWDFDPAAAKELWDAAGPIPEFDVWFNTGGDHEDWVEAVANMWRQNLGVDNVNFQSLEFAEYLDLLDNQEITGPFRLGWGQDYPSPLNFLEPLYASYNAPPVGSNNTFYNNPAFDEAIAAGKAKVAASGQLADGIPDYQAAEDLLCEDAQIAPIFFRTNQFVFTEGIDNVFFDSYSDLGYTKITSDDGFVSYQISEPEHLLPTTSNESNGIAVLRALFTGLVQYDPETNEQFNAHAESITSDDGGKTWTVVLKPDWTFHDGTPVTASNYVRAWSFGALGANAQQNNSFYAGIVGYEELNPSDG